MCNNGYTVCTVGFGNSIPGMTCADCPFQTWCESSFVRGEVILAKEADFEGFDGVDNLETALLAVASDHKVKVTNLAEWGEPMLRVQIG